ncbi:MAG: hypothetical protein ACMG6E_09265 [Candidatus Roizmanbacteria bacterium]
MKTSYSSQKAEMFKKQQRERSERNRNKQKECVMTPSPQKTDPKFKRSVKEKSVISAYFDMS